LASGARKTLRGDGGEEARSEHAAVDGPRRDTGHREQLPIELDGAAHDARIRRERSRPKLVPEHDDGVRAARAVALDEASADRGRLLENVEVAAGDEQAVRCRGLSPPSIALAGAE
jgi:hypothetical protein